MRILSWVRHRYIELALALVVVLLLVGIPFQYIALLTVLIGILAGIALIQPSLAEDTTAAIYWCAHNTWVSLFLLNTSLQTLQTPPISVWTKLWAFILILGISVTLLHALALSIRLILAWPRLALPFILIPLAAVFAAPIPALPAFIGLLGGLAFGFTLPRVCLPEEKRTRQPFSKVLFKITTVLLLLFGVVYAFEAEGNMLKSFTSAEFLLFGVGLFIFLLRARSSSPEVNADVAG